MLLESKLWLFAFAFVAIIPNQTTSWSMLAKGNKYEVAVWEKVEKTVVTETIEVVQQEEQIIKEEIIVVKNSNGSKSMTKKRTAIRRAKKTMKKVVTRKKELRVIKKYHKGSSYYYKGLSKLKDIVKRITNSFSPQNLRRRISYVEIFELVEALQIVYMRYLAALEAKSNHRIHESLIFLLALRQYYWRHTYGHPLRQWFGLAKLYLGTADQILSRQTLLRIQSAVNRMVPFNKISRRDLQYRLREKLRSLKEIISQLKNRNNAYKRYIRQLKDKVKRAQKQKIEKKKKQLQKKKFPITKTIKRPNRKITCPPHRPRPLKKVPSHRNRQRPGSSRREANNRRYGGRRRPGSSGRNHHRYGGRRRPGSSGRNHHRYGGRRRPGSSGRNHHRYGGRRRPGSSGRVTYNHGTRRTHGHYGRVTPGRRQSRGRYGVRRHLQARTCHRRYK